MALSKPPPHFTPIHNQDPPLEATGSIFTLSIDSSRRIRRDVFLSISATLIPQLLFFDRKRSSYANAANIFSFLAPQPEPERTVEIAQEGLRKNAENIKEIKEMMIESKTWKEGGKELRRNASNMKQDLYLIIQAKPPKDRPLLRSLYSSLFNTITKVLGNTHGDVKEKNMYDFIEEMYGVMEVNIDRQLVRKYQGEGWYLTQQLTFESKETPQI
ncbi:psbQ-like protein 3, chloroplastic isoform X2 [Eutrema salsugineum]|uniref:psbQ-like protein 3, chloroplastic isoform X2 n=1 Tax=Eutrema salsugineum TaxID=72664 RepID=UPI000CED4223|nr:psbQ-like protein 3, chloroplastic isoform X2 [Eutrema salsugineum]